MTSFSTLLDSLDMGDGALVSFVGAGGKTSLMSRLSLELYEQGRRVAVTTTTRMAPFSVPDYWQGAQLREGKEPSIDEYLRKAVMASKVPLFFSHVMDDGKLKGVSVETADRIFEQVDYLLVEADGARGSSFKVPRDHEPVLPSSTTHLCIVVGSDVFEQPASGELVFNLEDIASEGGIREGKVSSPESIRELMYREDGYLKHGAEGRKTIVLLNKVDSAEKVEIMRPFADELFHPSVDKTILCSSSSANPAVAADNGRDRIAAVVLAAGRSERYGRQKLCDEVAGEPMVRRVVRNALESQVDSVCVVLGHESEKTRQCLDVLKAHTALMTIENHRYDEGMGRSIAEGITAVTQWADAAMILLGDMPGIDSDGMNDVIAAYKRSNARLCFPGEGTDHFHPVIFRRDLFTELEELSGDEGGRAIVQKHRQWAQVIPMRSRVSQMDVDTPEDLARIRKIIK